MKKTVFLLTLLLAFAACQPKTQTGEATEIQNADATDNSQNSLDWTGTYAGTIPCANCEGINVKLILNSDQSYELTYQYLGKSEMPYTVSGNFTWNDDSAMVILDNEIFPSRYKVGENRLIQLDMEGNEITGDLADMYILTKLL